MWEQVVGTDINQSINFGDFINLVFLTLILMNINTAILCVFHRILLSLKSYLLISVGTSGWDRYQSIYKLWRLYKFGIPNPYFNEYKYCYSVCLS